MNLIAIYQQFPDHESCLEHLERVRWPLGAQCTNCGSTAVARKADGFRKGRWNCHTCKNSFNVLAGTFMQKTKIDLQKWFLAIGIVLNAKKGVSSWQLSRDLDLNQKTAWYMVMRIRKNMVTEGPLLSGIVEADEAYIGGKPRKRNRRDDGDDNPPSKRGRGTDKLPIVGAVERGGRVVAEPSIKVNAHALSSFLSRNIDPETSVLITGWIRYRKKPYTIIGPARTKDFVDRLVHAFEEDIRIRRLHDRVGEDVMDVRVVEVDHGDTFEGDGWRATALEVEHGYVKPALGFTFEEDRSKLVISGDTAVSDAIIEASSTANMLVHELMQTTPHRGGPAPDGRDYHEVDRESLTEFARRIANSHTCPHGLAEVAEKSGVPHLVATHIPEVLDEAWSREVICANYSNPFTFGEDLMTFKV